MQNKLFVYRFLEVFSRIRLNELKSAENYAPLLLRRPKKLSNLSSFLSDSMFGWASISINKIPKFHFSSYILVLFILGGFLNIHSLC